MLPGTSTPPERLDDIHAQLQLMWPGLVNGKEYPLLLLTWEVFDETREGDDWMALLEAGEPLDDCDVYSGTEGSIWWGYPEPGSGALDLWYGAVSFHLTQDGDGIYDGFDSDDAQSTPDGWGEALNVRMEDTPSVPGFDYQPVTYLPAGPVGMSFPGHEDWASLPPLPPDEIVIRWDGLGREALTLQLSPNLGHNQPVFNIYCTLTDDGEFVIPQHVWDWLGTEPFSLQVDLSRDASRYVEVRTDWWAAFAVRTTDSAMVIVDPETN